jgi:hypothetical protein
MIERRAWVLITASVAVSLPRDVVEAAQERGRARARHQPRPEAPPEFTLRSS